MHLHASKPQAKAKILIYSWMLLGLVRLGSVAAAAAAAVAPAEATISSFLVDGQQPAGSNTSAGALSVDRISRVHEDPLKPLGVQPPGTPADVELLQAPTMKPLTAETTNSSMPLPRRGSAVAGVESQVDSLNDGLCRIQMIPRRSSLPTGQGVGQMGKLSLDFAERSLICSQINEQNYRDMVRSIYKLNKLVIQQIHIVSSESIVVFSAIDLICDRFDCSRLTVFNVTGQRVHDCNVLTGWLKAWPQLEVLDLSNTSLSSIESILPVDTQLPAQAPLHPGQPLRNLTHLHLDDNNITSLDFNLLFDRMPQLRQLSLLNNSVFNIYCNESLRSRLRSQLEIVNLAGNAINCDKSQLWLLKLLQNSMTNLKFPDHDKINCSSPRHLIDLTWAQRINVHETKICDECNCQSLKRTAIQVDCHNKNLSTLPDVLPLNTKILNLTSNRISGLGVPMNARNWENVTYLHLEDNLISSFQQLNSKFMRNLAALDIRRNRFQEFPSHILEQFVNLDQVHLSNNPWLCDCESTFAFQEWLQRHFHQVSDKEEIRCGVSGNEENGLRSIDLRQRLSSRVIYKLSKSELCPQDIPYDSLDVINLVLGLAIFLTLTKVVVDYFYQRRTKRLPHFFKLNI